MTSKLEINVSFPKKLATMKFYLKQREMLRCSMQNEIVDCLKSVFPQKRVQNEIVDCLKSVFPQKRVRLDFLHFWSFSVAMPVRT
jgi:hypothetical protein